MSDVKALVVERARRCGFDLVGVTSAEEFAADRQAALERIREGRMDGLPWYTESRVMRGTSPAELLPGARSVICLGLSYWSDVASEGRQVRQEVGRSLNRSHPDLSVAIRSVLQPGQENGDWIPAFAGMTGAARMAGVGGVTKIGEMTRVAGMAGVGGMTG